MEKKNQILLIISILILAGVTFWQVTKSDEVMKPTTTQAWSSKAIPGQAAEQPNANNVSESFAKQVLDLETYLSTNPSDTTHLLMLARLYQDAHQAPKAIQTYEKLVSIQKNNPQVWLDLINTYGMNQNWEGAKKTCERMLLIFPNNYMAMYNLGAIYANQAQFKQAELWWKKVLAAKPTDDHVLHLTQDGLKQLASK